MANFIPTRGSHKSTFIAQQSSEFSIWNAVSDYNTNAIVVHDVNDDADLVVHKLYSSIENIVHTDVSHYTIEFDNISFDPFNTTLITLGPVVDMEVKSTDTTDIIAKRWADSYTKFEKNNSNDIRAKYIGSNTVDVAESSSSALTAISTNLSDEGITITPSSVTIENLSPNVNALWNNIDDDPEFSGLSLSDPDRSTTQFEDYFTIVSENAQVDGLVVPVYRPTADNSINIQWRNGSTNLGTSINIFTNIDSVFITPSNVTINSTTPTNLNNVITLASPFPTTYNIQANVTLTNGTTADTTSNTINRYIPFAFGFSSTVPTSFAGLNLSTGALTTGININAGTGAPESFYILTTASITLIDVLGFNLTVKPAISTITLTDIDSNDVTYNVFEIDNVQDNTILGNIR